MILPYLWHSDMVLNQFEGKPITLKRMGPPMTHKQELEMRLSDLNAKLAEERACLSPVQLYIDDLQLTIGYVERQIKTAVA